MGFDVDLDGLLEDIAADARPYARDGEVSHYIEAMARLDPGCFGLAVVEMDGTEHATGDADVPFAIQSISKVFSLVLAMRKAEQAKGVARELWSRVGREPSGDPFNSLLLLERERGIPRNPMINAGALVVDDILLDHCDDAPGELLALLSELAGEEIGVDEAVAEQEIEASNRNVAIASFMASFGNMHNPVHDVVESYGRQCAAAMTTRQLARAVRFLATDGVDPATGRRVLSGPLARRVAAIMLTCGTYDAAGEFAFSVGFPCKSGIAGAITGMLAHELGICVWSPPLDEKGNSIAGRQALSELSTRLDLSLF
jgi:glutaminase